MKLFFGNKIQPARSAGFSLTARRFACAILAGSMILSFPFQVLAGDASKNVVPVASPSIWEKPAWMTDLSLGVKESYDSNIYLSGAGSEYFPKTLPEGDIATKNKSSWVTTISPKIGVDFAKLLGSDSVVKIFAVGYVPVGGAARAY